MGLRMKEYSTEDMLGQLVAFDTTSWKSNLELINFVSAYLQGHGVTARAFFNPEGTKANLLATIGPENIPGIILSGHTDVVPVTEQKWSHDPFDMIRREDKVFGRGTCDMKGFIASVLAAVPSFVGADLKEPVHLALSYDEETGCTGVMSLVEHVKNMPVKPRACIIGEPTSMKVVNSHKGIRNMVTQVTGLEAHSSTDRGINAVMHAADMISYLSELAEEMRQRPPEIEGFDPPYTTIHVGRVTGGTAPNVTPSFCEFEWDCRTIPGSDQEEVLSRFNDFVAAKILPAMDARAPGRGKVTTEVTSHVPALLPETGSSAETLVMALANQNEVEVVSYGTEAGHFQQTGGVPTVVCGPGSILQAHRPDEYIERGQLKACDIFLSRLLDVIKK